jgi:Rrf2 family protein
MVALNKKTGYGLIAMAYLAARPEEVVSARCIAGHFGVPLSLLMNVMKELAGAGYVESVRGARGGYRLARSPKQISVADAIATLEGLPRAAECVLGYGRRSSCACQARDCPAADPVHQVQEKIQNALKAVTLAEIAHGAAFVCGELGGDDELHVPGAAEEKQDVAEAAHLPG